MRIVCDSCGAKYSIADDKIAGKLFKVRCKKCSNMIMVDGTELSGADSVPVPGAAAGPAAWYVVIDGAQAGPLSREEVTAQLNAGTIDGETFAWQEGMGDWERLADIGEFRSAVARSPVSPISQIAEVDTFDDESTRVLGAGESAVGAGAFVAAAGAPRARAGAGGARSTGAGGLLSHGAGAPSATSASSFFSASAASRGTGEGAAPPVGTAGGMTDERHESSVLFSLSDLTAKKKSVKEDLPTTEGSGLIDIRVLASGAAAQEPAAPTAGPAPGATMAMAPVMALPPRRSNTPLILMAVFGAIIIVALIGVLYVVATREPTPPAGPVAAVPATADQAEATAPTPVAPTEGSGSAVAAAVADGSGAGEGSAQGAGVPDGAVAAATAGATTPQATARTDAQAAAAPPEEAQPEPEERGERDDREERQERETSSRTTSGSRTPPSEDSEGERSPDAVNRALEALRRGQEQEEPEEEPEEAAPEGLERSEVQATIRRYGSRIRRCAADGASGTFRVSFVIQPSGGVTNARSDDSSDAAQCIVGVVRDMEFPSFRGTAVPVTYPFVL